MKWLERKSPLWYLWKLWFPHADMSVVFIVFGERCYGPAGVECPPDIRIHEITHSARMGTKWTGILSWHLKYRFSRAFRLQEEVEAFREQYMFGAKIMKTFRLNVQYANELADNLCSPTYGLRIHKAKALSLLYVPPERLR